MLALAEADFVDGDDVGMLQRSRGHGLGAEALHRLRRRVRPEQQQLEGDDPIQALLAGLIDHAHAAVPDLLQQFVVSERADLRKARRRGGSGRTIDRVVWVRERRLAWLRQSPDGRGTVDRTLSGRRTGAPRRNSDMCQLLTSLILYSLQRERRAKVT